MIIDYTHIGRQVTGIERISLELFSPRTFGKGKAQYVRANSILRMIAGQWITLPLAVIRNRRSLCICPGFPPSIFLSIVGRTRVIPYVHDMFLLSRPADLNIRAKLYMRPSFAFAVHHLRRFLVNSISTRDALRKKCRSDAEIHLLRPEVRNVFELTSSGKTKATVGRQTLRLLSIGTVEPRKNYAAANLIRKALAAHLACAVELHIVGRKGWGREAESLQGDNDVQLHGYCSIEQIQALIDSTDIFLATSKEEGLGLPLLEVQHGGIFVAAADIPVFREVLGKSGCLFNPDSADAAAYRIASELSLPNWRERHCVAALQNVERWNLQAKNDMQQFLYWIEKKEFRSLNI